LNVGWRRVEKQARVSLTDAGVGINVQDLAQVGQEAASEVPGPRIVGAKLVL